MAFEIHYTPDIRRIIQECSSNFRADLFADNKTFLFQNQNLQHWVTLQLTHKMGSHMALDSRFPDQALRELLQGFADADFPLSEQNEPTVLFLDDLKLVLFQELRAALSQTKHQQVWAPLKKYFGGNPESNLSKLYSFAQEVAGLFHAYAMNGPEVWLPWLRSYQQGAATPGNWQEALWRRVFLDGDHSHLGIEIQKVLDEGRSYKGKTKEIVVFGSLFLSPLALDLLYRFSLSGKVLYYLYFPLDQSPTEVQANSLNLGSWLKLLEVLKDWAQDKDVAWYPVPGSSGRQKILPHVYTQNPIHEPQAISRALEYHSCSTIEREVEVLRDRIWNFLALNPGVPMEEIGILAPDISQYAPWIRSIFGEKDQRPLPYNIVDLSFGEESPLIQAFWSLLDLVGSPWKRQDLMRLLAYPAVQKALSFHDRDRDLWEEFTQKAAITQGWDAQHLRALGLEEELSEYLSITWEQGFKRLVDGYYRAPQEKDWLHFPETWNRVPLEAIGAGNFSQILRLRTILQELYWTLESPDRMSLQDWAIWALDLVDRYLSAPTEAEQQSLADLNAGIKELLQIVKDLGESHSIEDLDFPAFKKILMDKFRRMSSGRGSQYTEGVTCCSIGPFRAMPFRVIALLGMNENEFPRSPGNLAINLLEAYEKTWMDSRVTDQYSLLEILGSAQDALWVFYRGIDPMSQERRSPSLPLEIFREQAQRHLRPGTDLTIEHSLVPYGPEALVKLNDLVLRPTSLKALQLTQSLDKKGAITAGDEPQALGPKGAGEYPENWEAQGADLRPAEENLDAKSFQNCFLRHHKWFCQEVLGITLPREEAEEEPLPGKIKPWDSQAVQYQILLHKADYPEPEILKAPLRWLREEGHLSTPLDQQYWSQKLFPFGAAPPLEEEGYRLETLELSADFGSGQSPPRLMDGSLGEYFVRDHEVLAVLFFPGEKEPKKIDFKDSWKIFWAFLLLQADDPTRILKVLLLGTEGRAVLNWSYEASDSQAFLEDALALYDYARNQPLALFSGLLDKVYKKSGLSRSSLEEAKESWESNDKYTVPSPQYQLLQEDFLLDETSLSLLDRLIPAVYGAFK
jgi:exonuclease V gamma subunit